jgi:hypothetical protein
MPQYATSTLPQTNVKKTPHQKQVAREKKYRKGMKK